MTGFGAASLAVGSAEASIELRSVNSRHLKLNMRLPHGLDEIEGRLRALLSGALGRGHVDVSLRVDGSSGGGSTLELDEDRVRALIGALEEMRERYSLPGEVDLSLVGRFDRLFRESSPSLAELVDEAELESAVRRALDQLLAMRQNEGERLAQDMSDRLAAIRSGVDTVERLAPARLDRERERLRLAVAELTERVELDDDRLAREVAILADKWDVGEEIVRARAHLDAFDELLDAPGAEPVGKRLGFLSQELLREINTIGSKANDAEMQHCAVEMKNELETLREQIENVE